MRSTGTVVFLEVTPEEVLARVGDTSSRPLLASDAQEAVVRLLSERDQLYRDSAHLTVSTDDRSEDEVVEAILGALEDAWR